MDYKKAGKLYGKQVMRELKMEFGTLRIDKLEEYYDERIEEIINNPGVHRLRELGV